MSLPGIIHLGYDCRVHDDGCVNRHAAIARLLKTSDTYTPLSHIAISRLAKMCPVQIMFGITRDTTKGLISQVE